MKHLSRGFSLTELLICFFISMLLITILIQHLLSVSRQYQYVHAVLDETIELQWVFDVMRARIRHAGFTPCRSLNQLKVIDTRDNPDTALKAIQIQSGEIPKLLIRKMDETSFERIDILTPDTLHIKNNSLNPDRPVIIADCTHAEVHSMQKAGSLIHLNKPLVFNYSPEVYIGEWVSEAFFLKQSKGLFIQQHRVDLMTKVKNIIFDLDNSKIIIKVISRLGNTYVLEENMRTPCM
ncbi:MAG: prepilin-type N-terminal cleavage/methylation domain-containing protein [Legionella sp.]|nr:prepilin-type N-terminal cleavage/methylation domain-containing protein [Legionella sp.]